jgi:hypothetical protein
MTNFQNAPLNNWFTNNGEVGVHVQACVARQQTFVPQVEHMTPMACILEVTNELIELLFKMQKTCVSLHVRIIQPIIIGFLIEKTT